MLENIDFIGMVGTNVRMPKSNDKNCNGTARFKKCKQLFE